MLTTAKHLSDAQLFTLTDAAVSADCSNTAELLVYLGEIERRGTYRERACSSMWVFCTERLLMSADVASTRLRAARVAVKYPAVVARVAAGELHVSGLSLLLKVLTDDNHEALLEEARGRSKRYIEEMVAREAPKPVVRDLVKPLGPAPANAEANKALEQGLFAPPSTVMSGNAPAAAQQAPVSARIPAPAAEPTYRIAFTASARTQRKLEEARDLLRHSIPDGKLDEVFQRALSLLVEETRRKKFGELKAGGQRKRGSVNAGAGAGAGAGSPTRPGPSNPSDINRATKREVAERDEHRCSYRDEEGNRCSATAWLEFDHIEPRALGGVGDETNVRLLCRAHNQLAAEKRLGVALMQHKRRMTSAARGEVHSAGAARADLDLAEQQRSSASSAPVEIHTARGE